MSYATDLPGVYHQAGIYTGKVLESPVRATSR